MFDLEDVKLWVLYDDRLSENSESEFIMFYEKTNKYARYLDLEKPKFYTRTRMKYGFIRFSEEVSTKILVDSKNRNKIFRAIFDNLPEHLKDLN